MILPVFLLLVFAYAIYFEFRVKRSGQKYSEATPLLISTAIPILTAVIMTYVFIIAGTARTVQFNVGGNWEMRAWSLWVDVWGLFVFLSLGSTIGNLIWMITAIKTKTRRQWLIPSLLGTVLSVMAFFTAGTLYPIA